VNDVVLIQKDDDGVGTLIMNRPESRNALNSALLRRLSEAVRQAIDDPAIRVIVLTGAGGGFCSGGDLKQGMDEPRKAVDDSTAGETKRRRLSVEERIARLRAHMEISRLLHETSKPTLAMIRGAAIGAGLSLAGACDLRIASENAMLMTGFAPYGFGGDFGGTFFWTRILGSARARELYLLSEKLDAHQALRIGMVTRVVPDDELERITGEIARDLASRLPTAFHYIKRNLNSAEQATLEQLLDLEATNMVLSTQAAASAHKARAGGSEGG
jgi:2-(1,2-epoxy-1,2-dihydrophenyl)acetyl-CoA isomerase